MHHMDWDNLRFFLAVARKGSVRAAANSLGVNHSTVARRISTFEKKLEVRLFERLPNGYVLTPTGEEMLKSAHSIEDEIAKLDRQVIGRDAKLNGVLRVTMPSVLASHLIMPDIAAFSTMYPGIKLELAFSNEEFNLRKREADIAIRLTPNPPEYLVGRKILHPAKGIYASKQYLKTHDINAENKKINWIGWESDHPKANWNKDSRFAALPIKHQADDLLAQLEAVKANMGIAMLPCFLADTITSLERIEYLAEIGSCGDLWILTHEDLRSTARVRAFINFMLEAFEHHRDLLEGRCYHNQEPKVVSSFA